MGGVFMKKFFTIFAFLALCGSIVLTAQLLSDRETLEKELVRLHVVGASNSEHDQAVKLSVRDAVVALVEPMLEGIDDPSTAKQYIGAHLQQIETCANEALAQLGEAKKATVSFMKEAFPTRQYDTFSLPAGIYDSLRVVIGEGEGKNWWCVVFPQMCYGAAVKQVTAGAGFSDTLTNTVTGEYKLRFFFLDVIGRSENFLRRG